MKKLTVALERCLPIHRQWESVLPSVNRLLYLAEEGEELGMATLSQVGWLPQSWVQLERACLGWFSILLKLVSRGFFVGLKNSIYLTGWARSKWQGQKPAHIASSLTSVFQSRTLQSVSNDQINCWLNGAAKNISEILVLSNMQVFAAWIQVFRLLDLTTQMCLSSLCRHLV